MQKQFYIIISLFIVCTLSFTGCQSSPEVSNQSNGKNAIDYDIARQNKYKVDFGEKNSPDYTEEFGGTDPLEGFNRSMFHVNKFGHKYLVQPIVTLWGSIFPRHVVECFNRFTENVAFPKRMVSSFLQAKFKGGGIVLLRFLTNTTVGIAGFYDPADVWFDLEPQDEDMGQAFASWGIGPGCYLHLPVVGPTNIRDGIGSIFDTFMDPKTYIYGGQAFTAVNKLTVSYRDIDTFMRSNADPYELSKRLYNVQRYIQVNNYDKKEIIKAEQQRRVKEYYAWLKQKNLNASDFTKVNTKGLNVVDIPGFQSQGAAVDTLRLGQAQIVNDRESIWVDVSLWNSDFFYQGSVRSVEVLKDKSSMPYKVWFQKDKWAPLAVLIPGTASHYSNNESTMLAEIFYNQGFTVAVISNSFNWEFMETAATVLTPGYIPHDVMDIRRAIKCVINDLEKNKDCVFPAKVLAGYSMGGIQSIFLAEQEKALPKPEQIGFDRYVAINPPVSLMDAARKVDKCMLAWKDWKRYETFQNTAFAATKYIAMAKRRTEPFGAPKADDKKKSDAKKSSDKKESVKKESGNKTEDSGKKDLKPQGEIPFDPVEAEVLIGYAFKISLGEMILTIHRQKDFGILKTEYSWGSRDQFYREVEQFTFMKYIETFLLKNYSEIGKHKLTVKELADRCDLRRMTGTLKKSNDIYVLHTANDFLQSSEEQRWLKATFGQRCVFFKAGGHLGELYFQKARNELVDMVSPVIKRVRARKVPNAEKQISCK